MSKSSDSSIRIAPPRSGPWSIILPAAAFLLFILLGALGFWRTMDRSLSDRLIKARITASPLKQSLRVYPVDLTDSAERNLGDRVDNRQAFSDLLSIMAAGKLSGGLDLVFQKNKDPGIDKKMAEAAAETSSLVLAIVPVPAELAQFTGRESSGPEKELLQSRLWHPRVADAGDIPFASTFLLPVTDLARNAKHLGHIVIFPDDDGLYRKIPLFYRWGDGYMPSFALALAAEQLNVNPLEVEIHAGSYVSLPLPGGKTIRIPIDRSGYAWVPYPALWVDGIKHYPLDAVSAKSKDPAGTEELINEWSDGIVVASDLTTAQRDFVSTPIEPVYPLSGLHLSLLNGILTDTFFHPSPLLFQIVTCVLLIAGLTFAGRMKRGLLFHLSFVVLLLLLGGAVCLLWFGSLMMPWFFGPALGLAAAWGVSFGMRLQQSREQRLLLESALNRYFSPALTARVLAEKKVDLIPVTKELTIVFVDISGFTRWSSDKSPELVHVFLTDYLESMSSILFQHGGTIDKFMGDGILAFFGDPLDQTDHVARALRAALDMQKKARELGMVWKDTAGMDVTIRIGINTGPVIVGNLGSRTRIEYTVIGAAVNLGQRMESNAPLGGVLVSESTWAKAQGLFQFGEVLSVKVKGYEAPVAAYVVEKEITAGDKGST